MKTLSFYIKKTVELVFLAALCFCLGDSAARIGQQYPFITVSASADGNWGLSFQQEGKPPVANASAEYLKQYNAWYADQTDEKVLYLTFDAGYENGNTDAILNALKKPNAPAALSMVRRGRIPITGNSAALTVRANALFRFI